MTIDGLSTLLENASSWAAPLSSKRAAFLGCGDSLAAARPSESLGHRVLSAGDVAWGVQAPHGVDVSIGLSWSGRTGATIQAAKVAKANGQPVWAITSNPESPLARIADQHLHIPVEARSQAIPTWGFALHSVAILQALDIPANLPAILDAAQRLERTLEAAELPTDAPAAITVAGLPDSYATAEFWSLKLIEATGVAARVVPLEEIGHVDYFIGPQAHLVLIPLVGSGRERAARLGAALQRNGNTVLTVDLASTEGDLNPHEFGLALSIAGGALAHTAAHSWGRPPFRGGAVDMSAQHIQVPASE